MNNWNQAMQDYQRMEKALVYIAENIEKQPGLKEIADQVGLSEYHFQRLFRRWVGISPKRFLQYLTKERARKLLDQSADVLSAAYASGLSGPGRLHDLFVTCEAVTPGEYKSRGEGLEIRYGFHPSPFGECLLAHSQRGITDLKFLEKGERDRARETLEKRWRKADLREDPAQTNELMEEVLSPMLGRSALRRLPLYLSGTNFQLKVWEALLRIPPGMVVSYKDIAVHIGMPKSTRAVGAAIGRNPIPVLIPCHRVIGSLGSLVGYSGGLHRKVALLGWEMALADGARVEA